LVLVQQAQPSLLLDVHLPYAITGSLAGVLTTNSIRSDTARWLVAWAVAMVTVSAQFAIAQAAVQADADTTIWLLHLAPWSLAFALSAFADFKIGRLRK